MTRKRWWNTSCATIAVVATLQPGCLIAAEAPGSTAISGLFHLGDRGQAAMVTAGKPSSPIASAYASNVAAEPLLTQAQKLDLLQRHVKYVFVLFQENRAFDFHFGTFPGAQGLFSQPAAQTPGFAQPLVRTDGSVGTISPFLIPQTVTAANGKTIPIYPADTDSVDHSHAGYNNALDVDGSGVARNDRYALNLEGLTTSNGAIVSLKTGAAAAAPPTLTQVQRGELVMAHDDCDTVPFLWQLADRFTLFDNFYQTIIGPSTPNAIAMIAGQSGQTQWALHPEQASSNTASPVIKASGGVPVVADPGPFPGSNLDFAGNPKPPYGTSDVSPATPTLNQTYASLPLSFMGKQINKTIASDQNPLLDLLDVKDDIATIAGDGISPVNWGWYQEGYDAEVTDKLPGQTLGSTYIVHHNGPQYFGYVGDNPVEQQHLHGLGDFFSDIGARKLPGNGGVFYIRGGYGNNDGLVPVDPGAANPGSPSTVGLVQKNFPGSDDHASYSDTQIAESLVADEVNAIAASPYWKESAIIITYDETDGDYDHAVPRLRNMDPQGNPLAGGPRIPAIVISPYSNAHTISHEYSEHSSVIKFINELRGLTPLASLPDEVKGFKAGLSLPTPQSNLGPADATDGIGDLFSAFDNARLTGSAKPLPASYAMIPAAAVHVLPHYNGQGCYALNIVPTDYQNGKPPPPARAASTPRPAPTPGTPTSGTWNP